VSANISSPTGVHKTKKPRLPRTERDQYNLASNLFRKMAETISSLTIPDFQEKMRLFHDIHALIKADKPIQLVQSSRQEDKKEEGRADLNEEPLNTDDSTDLPKNEKVILFLNCDFLL
jgi:hypothetical protein